MPIYITSLTHSFSKGILIVLILVFSQFYLIAQEKHAIQDFEDPESLVSALYDQVTFPAGQSPDWDYVRSMFIPQASVVMRTGKESTTTLTLDGWILDFVNFIHDANVVSTGFEEKIIKMESLVFGDIAHILVLYTAFLPGKTKIPREGVDSFHLIKKDKRWWIVSILNEIPTDERPKPALLKE